MSNNSIMPNNPVAEGAKALNGLFGMIKDISVSKEIQITERHKIDKQAQVIIALMERDYKMFELALQSVSIERNKLIDAVCDMTRRDTLDESVLKVCQMLLDVLMRPEMSLERVEPAKYLSTSQSNIFLLEENKNDEF